METNLLPNAGQYTITRHLPKTGQTTSYWVNDDGTHEAGWWRGRLNANNKTRFVLHTISGDNVVVDRATGLMWPKDFNGVGGNGGAARRWSGPGNAIDWAASLIFAGFDDWRLPNALELLSIAEFNGAAPFVYSIFDNPVSLNYWSSTTRPSLTTNAYSVHFLYPTLTFFAKTFLYNVIAVRDSRL